jgi:Mg-chelatase subunit ChlD
MADLQQGRRVIVVVVTDGEPSDGDPGTLFMLLSRARPAGFCVSLAECNDNEE